jgi:hypothetical protein
MAFTVLDIAPNPISANGILTKSDAKIRMESENVQVELYKEYSIVECTFEMVNYGEKTDLEIGFPVMDFHHWSLDPYAQDDKSKFKIEVDDFQLKDSDIQVPKELDSVYKVFKKKWIMSNEYDRKMDSLYKSNNIEKRKNGTLIYPKETDYEEVNKARDSLYNIYSSSFIISGDLIAQFEKLTKEKKYPWYVWNITFEKNEKRTIKVRYRLPSGIAYRNKYRYFKYILHSGAGWYEDIGNAEITLHLNDFSLNDREKISPKGYTIDKSKNTIEWNFKNLNPTEKDDIYFQYATSKDKRIFKKATRKRKRQMQRLKKRDQN